MKKYFEYTDEKSAKFWEITLEEATLKTRYGKIGSNGQTTEKTFANASAAQKEHNKLVKEKTAKGYIATAGNTKALTEKTDLAVFHTMPFTAAVIKYNLDFLPSYTKAQHEQEDVLIFEKDTHFEILNLEEYAATHNVNAFLFLQNLSATQYILQEDMDYGPTTIVLGNVSAKNIWCSGANIYFRGKLTASQSFIAGVYNHGELYVEGTIEAGLIYTSDHAFSFKEISKGVVVGVHESYGGPDLARYDIKDAIAKKYLDQGEYFNTNKALKAIKKGESLLVSAQPNTPLQRQLEKASKNGFTKIDLSGLNLTEIPIEIFDFHQLQELDLGGNHIKTWPIALKNFSELKKIRLSGCDLKEIPDVIFSLTSLESLVISRNYIKKIPDTLANLQSLKHLDLFDSGLHVFPTCIFKLPHLEILDIRSLSDLKTPVVINTALPSLKKLHAKSCHDIKIEVPLPALTEVNLERCSLKTIPETLFASKKLKKLTISHNIYMAELPESLAKLENLSELSISFPLHNVDSIQNLPKLSWLNVHFNGDDVPYNFEDILLHPNWTTLGIEGNIYDERIWKKIVSRKNLKKLIQLSYLGDSEMDIAEIRGVYGVEI